MGVYSDHPISAMTRITRILNHVALLTAFALTTPAQATHLVGGNIGYTYIGETSPGSQVYRYLVYMQFYLNCGDDSNWALQSLLNTNNGIMPVGVYLQDPLAPNADKQQVATANLTLGDSTAIVPNLPGGCTIGAGICTNLGTLSGTVDLPLNFGGYHLYFHMNARNLSITNLDDPNNTGIGFYAFIPPPLLPNSSPIWLGDPTPLLCINDTNTFVNSATDPDGDQLIFSFEVPYNSLNGGGGIIDPPFFLPDNIPLVDYLPGYSVTQPFGAGGYSFIDGATGLTRYRPTVQGNYVVAVEVKEYRNGILIGRTRRDLQLQAVVCPPNDAPEPIGVQPISYSVQAGDQLCFDLSFQDPNADSLQLTASGIIFNSSLFTPPATITAPVDGQTSVASTFCWDTDCAQAQDQPYLFSVSVTDNGCPPRALDVIYSVLVMGINSPGNIVGPSPVCEGQLGSVYTTPNINGTTFAWTVTGGSLVTGQGTNSITVDWGSAGPGSVEVVATNAQGCLSGPTTLQVNVVSLPVTIAGADVLVCLGAGATLGSEPTGPPGSSFQWTPAIGLDDPTNSNPVATPLVTTDYVVTVQNSGCANTDTVRVTVSDPQVDAGSDAAFCAGGSAQLQATGTGGFSWAPATGLNATDIADPIATPSITTTYTVTLTDQANCTDTDSVVVTVNDLPTASAGPDATPCASTTIQLGGAPTGPAGSTFAWSPAVGLNDNTLANPTLSVTVDVEYVVTVTDANSCVNTDTMEVTVLPLPDVDAGPDLEVCYGGSVQLQGSGTGALLWTPPFGLSDATAPDPICTPETTTIYTLTATGTNTCTNSDQATITVNVLPSANAGPDRSICNGSGVVIGTPGPGTFSWSPATGLSATDIASPTASPSVTTTYTVTVLDATTCTAQDEVVVTVNEPGNAGDDGSITTCSSGATVDLGTLLGGTPDAGGIWLDPSLAAHSAQLDPATDPSGNYTYVAGDGTLCPDSAIVVVTITIPQIQFTGDQTICAGDTTQITATGGDAYAWSPATDISDATIAGPLFYPGSSTTYTVTVTDGGGCTADALLDITVFTLPTANAGVDDSLCNGGSLPIGGTPTGPSGASFQWSPATELDDPTAANPNASPSSTTIYSVLVTDNNQCTATDTVMIEVFELPSLEAGSDVPLCTGSSVQLNATGTGSFVWSPGDGLSSTTIANPVASPTSTTAYTVTLTDGNGCSSTDGMTVTVNELPAVDAGSDAWLCEGSSVGLTGSGNGTAAWSPAGSLNDPTSLTPVATPPNTTTYNLTITDANNCSASDAVTITVGNDPPIDAGSGASICGGSPVTLGGSPTSVPGSSFQWTPATGLNDPTSPNPIATPTVTTTYVLTVSNDTCTSTASATITINALGQAGFTARFEPGCETLRGFLTDTSTDAVSWNWDLGNGTTSTDQDPQVFLPYGQASTVTLEITDAQGCTDSFSQTYTMADYNEMVDVEIPNVFTPNGDGKNDVFTLNSDALLGPCTSMDVMNRWGQKVFVSLGNNITWDGRNFSGEICSAGTYFYVIKVKDLMYEGSVTLVR